MSRTLPNRTAGEGGGLPACRPERQDAGPTESRPVTRVLHVVPALHRGGMELAMLRLLDGLQSSPTTNHAVCVLQSGDPALLEQCRSIVPTFSVGAGGPGKRFAAYGLRDMIRAFSPDVVHARSTAAWFDTSLAIGLPAHSHLILSFHGRTSTRPVSKVRRMINRLCATRADAVLSVSDAGARMLSGEWGIPARKLKVIQNCVDHARFHPASTIERDAIRRELGLDANVHVVACVGSLAPVKGMDVLLRAWRQVRMADPWSVLLLAGDGPLRTELERLAVELRCADSVRFLGRRADVDVLLRAADLFVLPSRYEGTSNAVLEAMATGLPVVASDVGGMAELIMPNQTGWLVPSCETHRLAETILGALLDRTVRSRVGGAARESVIRRFSLPAWFAAYALLYQDVASGAARARTVKPPEGLACAG